MNNTITIITQSVIAFIATNIDDILILLLFFSQINTNFRRRHIVVGQYLGFTIIIIASLPGFFGGLVVPRAWIGLLGILPITIGIKQLFNQETEKIELQTVTSDFTSSRNANPLLSFISSLISPQTYKVAAVTFANGGDNISIYIPFFAGIKFNNLLITLAVFFIMVGVWCAVTYLFARQATIASFLSHYGSKIVPFVLIILGLYIMYERGTFSLLSLIKY
ncbi:MAG: cadmium resistance transporter [Pelatocladus maniniholoensis HA4357-MV3]|jgi:cadmium resistance transport/sequestration family protein|uniref:Cadmium resistance transporter n=1 Tax=Pelatocladus maniniholoensis HA4357-MV3 TaxID=1117104 RepID=A0A9E3H7M4_9NOST|nr:cadmium resistance transporter [Pelatocladus maniniholoensis HA4357-MV3]BAZ66817.1 cadmium resistance transporter [Fischerella sp. NIES-4106]